ncbi:hypothetical protein FACS1894164_10480 [Spirochaetia bacterium]|nr:hypothetical protein FACS1894164_10480 [Spirochaetia bacterium]
MLEFEAERTAYFAVQSETEGKKGPREPLVQALLRKDNDRFIHKGDSHEKDTNGFVGSGDAYGTWYLQSLSGAGYRRDYNPLYRE